MTSPGQTLHCSPACMLGNKAPNSFIIISYYWTSKLKFSILFKATQWWVWSKVLDVLLCTHAFSPNHVLHSMWQVLTVTWKPQRRGDSLSPYCPVSQKSTLVLITDKMSSLTIPFTWLSLNEKTLRFAKNSPEEAIRKKKGKRMSWRSLTLSSCPLNN